LTEQLLCCKNRLKFNPGDKVYHATIRTLLFTDTGVIKSISFGANCGHNHPTPDSADLCINKLAKYHTLKYGQACVVERVDGQPLSPDELQQIAAAYGASRAA
jgi:hypothetical protein